MLIENLKVWVNYDDEEGGVMKKEEVNVEIEPDGLGGYIIDILFDDEDFSAYDCNEGEVDRLKRVAIKRFEKAGN